MKFTITIIAAIAAAAIIAAPAQAASSVCRDGSGSTPRTCDAVTTDQHTDQARIRTGEESRARWVLRCTQGSHSTKQDGFVAKGGLRTPPILLPNPDCVLRAHARSGTVAKVRVTLL